MDFYLFCPEIGRLTSYKESDQIWREKIRGKKNVWKMKYLENAQENRRKYKIVINKFSGKITWNKQNNLKNIILGKIIRKKMNVQI